jgi:hypothetical protein
MTLLDDTPQDATRRYITLLEQTLFDSVLLFSLVSLFLYFVNLLFPGMGGSVVKDVTAARMTHLVTDSCRGEKYRYASTFGIPVMSRDWLMSAWDNR